MGGEIVIVGPVIATATAATDGVIFIVIIEVVIIEVVIVGAEARTPQRLTETRWAALYATARVMHTPDWSPAVPTGEVDDPARAPPLVPPTDGLEEPSADWDGVGQAADLVHHLPLALWARGHGDASFALRCRQCSVALGCDNCRIRAPLQLPIPLVSPELQQWPTRWNSFGLPSICHTPLLR
jgi:hypothetical protein